jgi:proteasome component ECM29
VPLQVRSAACIWLVSLVSFTRKSPALLHRLDEIQEAFSHLLGDSNELIQEMASRGISAVYRLGSDTDRKGLLTGLMATLQGAALTLLPHFAVLPKHSHG